MPSAHTQILKKEKNLKPKEKSWKRWINEHIRINVASSSLSPVVWIASNSILNIIFQGIFVHRIQKSLPFIRKINIFYSKHAKLILKKRGRISDTNIEEMWENIRYGGRVFLRQAAMGLYSFHPHCLQSALSPCPKLRFGPEKLINSTLLAAGGNNTSELIRNWTLKRKVYFCFEIAKWGKLTMHGFN